MAISAEKVSVEKAADKPAEKRRALGRGLESLLPAGPRVVTVPAHESGPSGTQAAPADGTPAQPAQDAAGSVVELQALAARKTLDGQPVLETPIDAIDQNPHQTRKDFNQAILQELADSIKVQGVLQPIVVRTGQDGRYILILGERRLRAAKLAGKTTIPAIVKRVSEQQAAEMTIVENLQRQDLDCLEQAAAFANLSSEFGLTQEEIGKRVGASRETVSNHLRLLRLPEQVQTYLRRGELTFSHARELLMLEDGVEILRAAEIAVRKKMSVAALQALVWDMKSGPREEGDDGKGAGARWVDPNVLAAQRQLETVLGVRVRIRDRKGKGKITIEYGTLEDFDRVVEMLKGKKQ